MTNQPNEATERTRERLATLLQQAQDLRGRGNHHEADAALARAEAIMIKYALDESDALARDGVTSTVREAVQKLVIPLTGIYRQAEATVLAQVAKAFGTAEAIIATDWNGRGKDELWIVSHASELARLNVMLASIRMQLKIALDKFWNANKNIFDGRTSMEKFKARRQFMLSFGRGVAERIERTRAEQVAEHPGVALMLEAHMTDIKDFLDQFQTRMTKSRVSPGSYAAHQAGLAAGLATPTGETPVGSSARPLIGR